MASELLVVIGMEVVHGRSYFFIGDGSIEAPFAHLIPVNLVGSG